MFQIEFLHLRSITYLIFGGYPVARANIFFGEDQFGGNTIQRNIVGESMLLLISITVMENR